MPKPVEPLVKSFLLADSVFRQEAGKWCLIGIFNRIQAASFPTVHHSLGLYVELTDAEGEYDVVVEFWDAANQCLARFEGIHVEVADRLAGVQFGFQTYGLPLPSPGRYYFKLFFNGLEVRSDIPVIVEQGELPA